MGNHILQSRLDSCRQIRGRWDSRTVQVVHQRTPNIDRNMLHHRQLWTLTYTDRPALASGNDMSLRV